MAKKPSLTEALQIANRQTAKPAAQPVPEKSEKKTTFPSREGKKPITAFFDPAVSRQLKHIALDEETTIQELIKEALNDLFQRRGKPPIA